MHNYKQSAHTLNPAQKIKYFNASRLSNTPFVYGGLRIYVDHPSPKVFIGRYWWLSDELREAMQTRMIALFGYRKSVVQQGEVLVIGDKAIMHPTDMVTLRKIA